MKLNKYGMTMLEGTASYCTVRKGFVKEMEPVKENQKPVGIENVSTVLMDLNW